MRVSFFILFLLFISHIEAQERLSYAEGPGPLFSIGQNIIPKHEFNVGTGLRYRDGVFNHRLRWSVGGIYGITDHLSATFVVPYILKERSENKRTSGIADMILDLEYAFFEKKEDRSLVQATIIGGIQFPTSDKEKKPLLDFGSWSGFIGFTNSFLFLPWYWFFSGGVLITRNRDNIEFGNEYFYESGAGVKLIKLNHDDNIALLIEMNGRFLDKSKITSQSIPAVGGHVLYVGPIIRLDWRAITTQAGIQFAAAQHIFNSKEEIDYRVAFSISGGF